MTFIIAYSHANLTSNSVCSSFCHPLMACSIRDVTKHHHWEYMHYKHELLMYVYTCVLFEVLTLYTLCRCVCIDSQTTSTYVCIYIAPEM